MNEEIGLYDLFVLRSYNIKEIKTHWLIVKDGSLISGWLGLQLWEWFSSDNVWREADLMTLPFMSTFNLMKTAMYI